MFEHPVRSRGHSRLPDFDEVSANLDSQYRTSQAPGGPWLDASALARHTDYVRAIPPLAGDFARPWAPAHIAPAAPAPPSHPYYYHAAPSAASPWPAAVPRSPGQPPVMPPQAGMPAARAPPTAEQVGAAVSMVLSAHYGVEAPPPAAAPSPKRGGGAEIAGARRARCSAA